MIGLATTRCALIRGGQEDELGDIVDLDEPVRYWGDFAVSVIEKSRSVQDPSTGTWRRIAYLVARVPANLPLEIGDRLRDNRDGTIFAIDDSTQIRRGIGGASSLTLEIRQTSA